MQYSHSPFIDQLTKEKGIQRFSEIFDLIETGKKTEVLKNIPTEMLFEIAEGLLNGAINYFKENKEEITNKDRLEDAFSAFWDGIKG